MQVLVAQLCPTLFDYMDCNSLGSSAHGILQAGILEWIAIASPGDLPDPWIDPVSIALAGRFFTTEPPNSGISTQWLYHWYIQMLKKRMRNMSMN